MDSPSIPQQNGKNFKIHFFSELNKNILKKNASLVKNTRRTGSTQIGAKEIAEAMNALVIAAIGV